MAWWLVHTVGDSDLGVSSARVRRDHREGQRAARLERLRTTVDPAELSALLRDLRWDGSVTGDRSPVGFATAALPDATVARLLLVATAVTVGTATALADAVERVPAVFGRAFDSVEVVRVGGPADAGGLGESAVTEAVSTALGHAADADRALVTWGSGSTQLTLGVLDAVVMAGVPWLLGAVGPSASDAPYQVYDPVGGLPIDPVVPLLRRWRHHHKLAELVRSGTVLVDESTRLRVLADADRWREAHLRPTADGLRLLMADAMARGDATSGFAVRRYILARYHELRLADPAAPADLEEWARQVWTGRRRGPTLGELLGVVSRAGRAGPEPRRSLASPSGQWLRSGLVKELNRAGVDSSHRLAPPRPAFVRRLRSHLTGTPQPGVGVLPATAVWYVGLISANSTGAARPELLREIAGQGADATVCEYLGVSQAELRFLVLGTEGRSEHEAASLAAELNAAVPGSAAHGVVPGPGTVPAFDTAMAYKVLARRYAAVRDEIGAVVLVPTGLKVLLLPVLLAAQRLAAEHGVPFYLRQLTGTGPMHRLPVRFGADRRLLDIALDALESVELDVAARLLDACSSGREAAARARELANAVCCRAPGDRPWPSATAGRRSVDLVGGLLSERLDVWADLADRHNEAGHAVRALFGACAVVEKAVRFGQADGDRAWQRFRERLRRSGNRVLTALFDVRNELPISHGTDLPSAHALDALVGRHLPGAAGVAVLVRAAAVAVRKLPEFRPVPSTDQEPSLSRLLDSLTVDVRQARDAELARLAGMRAGEAAISAALGPVAAS